MLWCCLLRIFEDTVVLLVKRSMDSRSRVHARRGVTDSRILGAIITRKLFRPIRKVDRGVARRTSGSDIHEPRQTPLHHPTTAI